MTMPRPSFVTSSGPSPVRGFMAAIGTPLPGSETAVVHHYRGSRSKVGAETITDDRHHSFGALEETRDPGRWTDAGAPGDLRRTRHDHPRRALHPELAVRPHRPRPARHGAPRRRR